MRDLIWWAVICLLFSLAFLAGYKQGWEDGELDARAEDFEAGACFNDEHWERYR